MADVIVWGTLPKAQDDSTTIDAAIAAAVAAHNDDPTAHMSSGQSIDVHRSNDILDHPVGSLVSDKVTTTEEQMYFSFESLDAWTISANVTVAAGNGVLLDASGGTGVPEYVTSDLYDAGAGWGSTDADWLIQFTMTNKNDTPARMTLGAVDYSGSVYTGVGFKWDGTHLTAVCIRSPLNFTSSNLTIDITKKNVLRVQYIKAFNTIYWYVNGVQVASLALSTFSGFLFETIQFDVWGTDVTEPQTYISQLLLSRAVVI